MSITFYTTIDSYCTPKTVWDVIPNVPMLLPASSWAAKIKNGQIPTPKIPSHLTELAADCGGFVATFKWGDYTYTPSQYVEWLQSFSPSWAATMDYCCEDEITSGKPGIVKERQDRTTRMAYLFWRKYRKAPWTWVPTIQGWKPEDYKRHAEEMAPLIFKMRDYYQRRAEFLGIQSVFRVGIGTLCRRASSAMIREIVHIVASVLPGVNFHLWGVKLSVLKDRISLPLSVVSVDSAAWHSDFGSKMRDWKETGKRRTRWRFEDCLPEYLDKIESALSQPKQLTMF